ncbi:sulfoxide reductase heme-binding subunit YedZ [Acetobacteraceae bacterium]|nr:sulfoxide reductase heme-binding subunit YedZ [Acetobacteraceae bacterium]
MAMGKRLRHYIRMRRRNIIIKLRNFLLKMHRPFLYFLFLVPGFFLYLQAETGALGIDPVIALERGLGLWSFRFLLLCIALLPLSKIFSFKKLLTYRRMIGLTAFFYACAHLAVFVFIDLAGEWQAVLKQITHQLFMQCGAIVFVILLLLAVTSNQKSMRLLKRRWKKLHRLVYPAIMIGMIHFFLTYKTWTEETLFYSLVLGVILLARFRENRLFRPFFILGK